MSDISVPEFLEPAYVIEDRFDENDFEAQQAAYEENGAPADGAFVADIFHGALSGAPRIDMYRSWVWPDLYPDERQPVLKNWSDDDLVFFCGIYNREGIK